MLSALPIPSDYLDFSFDQNVPLSLGLKPPSHLIKEGSKLNIPFWNAETSWGGQKELEMPSD